MSRRVSIFYLHITGQSLIILSPVGHESVGMAYDTSYRGLDDPRVPPTNTDRHHYTEFREIIPSTHQSAQQ